MTVARLADIERARATPGAAALLYITDRCPVGCGHCSVSAVADGPGVRDRKLFHAIVEGLASMAELEVVGISGGEPFVERYALSHAVDGLSAAGKRCVVYSSGLFARGGHIPNWAQSVIEKSACIVISTDAFHAEGVSESEFLAAIGAVISAGTGLVIQVLDIANQLKRTRALMCEHLDADQLRDVDWNPIQPLAYGRGASLFQLATRHTPERLGRCQLLGSPTIRYDGRATACCNEEVISGRGPRRLQRQCDTGDSVRTNLRSFRSEPSLSLLANTGSVDLLQHPKFAPLRDDKYGTICELCWAVQSSHDDLADERLLQGMATVVSTSGGMSW